MSQFSVTFKKISSIFFNYRNQITVFTEDNIEDKQFYVTLLKRLVNEEIIINDIIPLGCKNTVISSCIGEADLKGKIYVVDGDLDLITSTNVKNVPGLFILNAYCIENFLIDENAVVKLLFYHGLGEIEIIKRKLLFEKWLGYNAEILIELFLHLSIAKDLKLSIELNNAHKYLKQIGTQTVLDIKKVAHRIVEVRTKIIEQLTLNKVNSPNEEYNSRILDLKSKWPVDNINYITIVSGKNYLVPLLQFRLRHTLSNRRELFPIKSLKTFLADNCKLERLNSLRNEIILRAKNVSS